MVNRISNATGVLGRLYHRLWCVIGIYLKTNFAVLTVILTTLVDILKSWTLYRTHIHELDVFHKHSLNSVAMSFPKVFNSELVLRWYIGGSESLLMQYQLWWDVRFRMVHIMSANQYSDIKTSLSTILSQSLYVLLLLKP